MPEYQVTITYDDAESMTPRGAAEGVYLHLMMSLIDGPCTLEVKNKRTGEVDVTELERDTENDESMLRYMALTMLASDFLTPEQSRDLAKWESENLDGHSKSTSDWHGWEPLVGRKPKKFREAGS